MSVRAKITAYNKNSSSGAGCSDFSMNMYWGDDYKNVYYLCGDEGRPEFIDVIETDVDVTGQTTRTQNTSIERFVLSVMAISPVLQFLKTIDKHDVKIIEYLDSGVTYNIKNIDIEDTGDVLNPTDLVYIKFEVEANSKATDVVYTLDAEKQAFWDNDNDGIKDIDGEAEYNPAGDFFSSWQLYFESDGVTPATSGNVLMLVYAVNPASTPTNTIESLVGVFRGEFTDLFSDSTKWQSTQQIWDYFNVADSVGHTNRVMFDKRAFAQDNGYFSSETEDRAVDLRFDLSIDNSGQEGTTLSRVYSVKGAFNASRIQNPSNSTYGVTTLGKVGQKNVLSEIQDVRTPLAGGPAVGPITVATLNSVTPFSNEYILGVGPAGEHSYDGSFTTKGGYIASMFRGSYSSCNFAFGLDEAKQIFSNENILNFTLGGDPLVFRIDWKYERNAVCGAFTVLGDITLAGAAVINLDNVLATTLPSIAPATTPVTGIYLMTLPDTAVHTVTLTLPTTTGFNIYNEFEVQVVPIF